MSRFSNLFLDKNTKNAMAIMEDVRESGEILFESEITPNQLKQYLSVAPEHIADINGVRTISVYGPLGYNLEDVCGFWGKYATDYLGLEDMVKEAEKDPACKSILLVINSPGGYAEGLLSLCNAIAECKKPKEAYIERMACSAAYAIAVATDKVTISPNAETGCCGCYAEMFGLSEEAIKGCGLDHKVFRSKNAPMKNLSPITDETAQAEYQAMIDAKGEEYLSFVMGRRKSEDAKAFGEGRVVDAKYALENNMVDAIDSFENVLGRMADENGTTSSPEEESEGEDMDIAKMSAEEKKTLFTALAEDTPSLLSDREQCVVASERERVKGLLAIREHGAEIVDAAIADGRSANDIALELLKAEKPKAEEAPKGNPLGAIAEQANATQSVNAPVSTEGLDEFDSYVKAAEDLNKSFKEAN